MLENAQHVAEFYAGYGTYSFPLIDKGKKIAAYEGGEDMVLIAHDLMEKEGLEESLSLYKRDLLKHPVHNKQMDEYDAVLINPPRNGAGPQVKAIAQSSVDKVVMVSCSTQSLEKDASILQQAGYVLEKAVIIDQFVWSKHIETVTLYQRST